MIQFFEFTILVIIVSVSGVMAPGPLFAANVSYGLKGGAKTGIKMAIGHTIVELPLVILLGIGVFSLEIFPEFRTIISILGAITLFVFATIGFKLISDAMILWSFGGILIMFVLHIWMDFVWLGAVSFFASKSSGILSNRNYKVLMLGISGMLVYFGITFLIEI